MPFSLGPKDCIGTFINFIMNYFAEEVESCFPRKSDGNARDDLHPRYSPEKL